MPLSLFHHDRLAHYQSDPAADLSYGHTFGGKPDAFGLQFVNLKQPFHLLYRLNQEDSAVPKLSGTPQFLPLLYGFRYASLEGEMIYQVNANNQVKVLSAKKPKFEKDFPFPGHAESFPLRPVGFTDKKYDPTDAFDALGLQGVFGLDRLSPQEMERAIRIGLSDNSYVSDPHDVPDPDWTDEEILRCMGRAPFGQGRPSKSCSNPECTAEIDHHVPEDEIELDDETAEVLGTKIMKIGGYDVRVPTMQVIALHQSDDDQKFVWGGSCVQLVFEYCQACGCIRVSNQCD